MIVLTILGIISMLSVGIFGLVMGMALGYGAGYEQAITEKMTKKQKEKYYQDKQTLNDLRQIK